MGLLLGASASIFVHQSLASEQNESTIALQKVSQRWAQESVEIVLDESLKTLGIDVEKKIRAAFLTWSNTDAHLPVIHFSWGSANKASLEPDGQSTILIAPIQFEDHESDLAITIGFSNPQTGEISEADIVINSKHLFDSLSTEQANKSAELASSPLDALDNESCSGSLDARACNETYDLENVLAHEVGHFFGLGEDYDDTRATMFSCTSSCEIHKRTLEPGDITSIVALYRTQFEADTAAVACGIAPGRGIGYLRPYELSQGKYPWGALTLLLGLLWLRRSSSRKS